MGSFVTRDRLLGVGLKVCVWGGGGKVGPAQSQGSTSRRTSTVIVCRFVNQKQGWFVRELVPPPQPIYDKTVIIPSPVAVRTEGRRAKANLLLVVYISRRFFFTFF